MIPSFTVFNEFMLIKFNLITLPTILSDFKSYYWSLISTNKRSNYTIYVFETLSYPDKSRFEMSIMFDNEPV